MERTEKLMHFRSIILSEVSQRCREIDGELQDYRRQELARAEDAVLQESYRLIQKEVGEINAETTKKVSRMRVEMKRKLYARRDEYVTKIFAQARVHLMEFTATPRYRDFLLNQAQALGKQLGDNAVLGVCVRDLAFKEELKKAYGHPCEVQESPVIKLGGIIAENPARASVADESLDALLEAQREWLYSQPDFVIAI